MKKVLAILFLFCAMSSVAQADTSGSFMGGLIGAIAGSQVGGGNGRLAAIATGAVLGTMVGDSMSAPPPPPVRRVVYRAPQYGQQQGGGDPELEAARAQGRAEHERIARQQAIQAMYQCGRDGSC